MLLALATGFVLLPALFLLNAYRGGQARLRNESALQAKIDVAARRDVIVTRVDTLRRSASVLAHEEALRRALREPSQEALARANAVLDTHRELLNADVAYLLDGRGTTIATSNRNARDSFLGKSYSFRPYFLEAISGKSSAYLALGVTSGRRGVYLAHPVADGGLARGVAVLKESVEDIERSFTSPEGDVYLLTDPHGVVFMSSSPTLLFKTWSRLGPEELAPLVKSQQFGTRTLGWSGLRYEGSSRVRSSSGDLYEVHEVDLPGLPGWHLRYLDVLRLVPMDVVNAMGRASSLLFLGVLPGLAILVSVLYRAASRELALRAEAEAVLREEETKFRAVAETAGFAIVSADDRGLIVFWNDAAERIFGYEGAEALGKPVSLLVPESLRASHAEGMARYHATGDAPLARQTIETRGLRKSGEEFPVELSVATWRLHRRPHATAILQDVTLRREMGDRIQALLEYNRSIFDAVQVGIRVIAFVDLGASDEANDPCFPWHERIGARAVITDVNATLTQVLGFSREAMVGASLFEPRFIDDHNAELLVAQAFGRRRGLKSSYELTLKHQGGGFVPVLVNAIPTAVDAATGQVTQSLAVLTDLTELKKAAAERERLLAELQEAAASIKTLTGLLPICAGCKKIRDGENRWSPVEVYVSAHSGAEFSHGMCPDCIALYYPELRMGARPDEKA